MPLPPVAAIALRYGSVALAGYIIARALPQGRRDQRAEDALDDLGEGMAFHRDSTAVRATGRLRRVLRAAPFASGIEIDFAVLSRLRLRRVPPE